MAKDVVEERNAQAVLQTIREQNRQIAELTQRLAGAEAQMAMLARSVQQAQELSNRAIATAMGHRATS